MPWHCDHMCANISTDTHTYRILAILDPSHSHGSMRGYAWRAAHMTHMHIHRVDGSSHLDCASGATGASLLVPASPSDKIQIQQW